MNEEELEPDPDQLTPDEPINPDAEEDQNPWVVPDDA